MNDDTTTYETDETDETPEGHDRLEETRTSTGRSLRAGLHPVNTGHLVMGVALVGLTVIWMLVEAGVADTGDLRWLLPIPWVAAGLTGLIASAPRLRTTRD